MKDYARDFYRGRAWNKTRQAYMASRHYVCERCGDLACIVHHRIYITPENIGDPNITLHWDNLEALCQTCHNQEHLGGEVCAEGLTFNSRGELIEKRKNEEIL